MNLTANASRLGLRIQETLSEHARELNLGVSSNATLFDTPEAKINDIRRQLDGSNDRETLEGLKRLIAVRALPAIECTSVLFDVDDLQRP
jgi:AP-3 complex subunit beta